MSKLVYFGHSCFKLIADNGYEIVFDPYQKDSVPGCVLPSDFSANLVLCSHNHADHNAKDEVRVINANIQNPYRISTLNVPHDDHNGELRGMNLIHILQTKNEKIVHFGDIGRMINNFEIKVLQNADVIMIPCGGFYTIDAKTVMQIIDAIHPKTTVLMHYRKNKKGYDEIASIEEVKSYIPNISELNQNKIELQSQFGIVTLSA